MGPLLIVISRSYVLTVTWVPLSTILYHDVTGSSIPVTQQWSLTVMLLVIHNCFDVRPAPFITWLGLGAGSGNALLILAGSRKY